MLTENTTNYGSTPCPPVSKEDKSKTRCTPLVLLTGIAIIIVLIIFNPLTDHSNRLMSYIKSVIGYEQQDIIIQYDYDDYLDYLDENMPDIADDDIDSSFGSLTWLDFHNKLLSKKGYNPTNNELHTYSFTITDDYRRGGGGGGRGGKGGGGGGKGGKGKSGKPTSPSLPTPEPTPRPVDDGGSIPTNKSPLDNAGNFECFTKYKYGNIMGSDFTLSVDCYEENEDRSNPSASQMTGCISYSGKNKYRSGEFMSDTDNKCKVWSKAGQSVGVGARCCKSPLKGSESFSVLPLMDGVSSENRYCETAGCQNGIVMGCTGNVGTGEKDTWSQQVMGTKVSDKFNECDMSRHDKVGKMDDTPSRITYLEVNTLCGTIGNGATIDCYDVEGKNPPNLQKKYKSTAMCSNGYALVDCNAFIDKGIDMCFPNWENYGVSQGGYFDTLGSRGMDQVQCVAEGSWMYITAQARCCRVV